MSNRRPYSSALALLLLVACGADTSAPDAYPGLHQLCVDYCGSQTGCLGQLSGTY